MPSLIWHIVKRDFRHLWLWLAIWWGLLVATAVTVAQYVQRILTQRPDGDLIGWLWFFVLVDAVVLMVVVDAILKSDSPIDERAFWRTRPIGKGRMFAAKLASIGLFCFVVPGIIQAAERLIFGFSVGEFLRGIVQFAIVEGLLVALVICAAVLYQRTVQGLLIWVGIFFGFAFLEAVGTFYLSDTIENYTVAAFFIGLTSGWPIVGLIFGTAFVVTAMMYAGLARRVGKLALIFCLLFVWVLGAYYQAEVYSYVPFADSAPRNDTIKLNVSPRPETNKLAGDYLQPYYKNRSQLYAAIDNPSFPELKDSVWLVYGVQSRLQWPGDKSAPLDYNSRVVGAWGIWPSQLINAPAAIAAAGYGRLAWEPVGTWRNFPVALVNDFQLERIKKEPAQITAQVYIASGHLERIAEIPAGSFAWLDGITDVDGILRHTFGPFPRWHDGLTTICVRSIVLNGPAGATLHLDEVRPWYLHMEPFRPWDHERNSGNLLYLLYNPTTQECVEGLTNGGNPEFDVAFVRTQPIVYFNFTNKNESPGPPPKVFADKKALADWLKDARLVELRFVHNQNFYVPVTIDLFLLPPSPAAATGPKR